MENEYVQIWCKDEDVLEDLYGIPIGEELFEIVENSFFNRIANIGTKVKAQRDHSQQWVFKEIIERSPFVTRYFTIPPFSPSILEEYIGKPILEAGGYWEVGMGSLAMVTIPRKSDFDLDALFKELDYHPGEW